MSTKLASIIARHVLLQEGDIEDLTERVLDCLVFPVLGRRGCRTLELTVLLSLPHHLFGDRWFQIEFSREVFLG